MTKEFDLKKVLEEDERRNRAELAWVSLGLAGFMIAGISFFAGHALSVSEVYAVTKDLSDGGQLRLTKEKKYRQGVTLTHLRSNSVSGSLFADYVIAHEEDKKVLYFKALDSDSEQEGLNYISSRCQVLQNYKIVARDEVWGRILIVEDEKCIENISS